MTQYKAIIFDLDGTAIPNVPNGLPSDAVTQAVINAKDGMKMCAATGRSITNAKPILDQLKLTDPCIISAGTQIVDPKSGKILWEVAIENDDAQAVLEVCKPYRYEVIASNELMGEGAPAANRTLTGSVNVMYIMQCTEADGNEILEKLANIPDITAAGVPSWTGEGLDVHVTHKNATKEHAIAKLLEMIHVHKEETIGVGDGGNDIHLFAGVGHRVAMGNAVEQLKAAADEIAPSIDEDGLAWVIEKYSR